MKKKVLIITYYWPPAGGSGVQRWLKFVKYLPEFGIDPIVYIPKNPNYPITDTSLEKEVSEDITILKHPIKEPYRWAHFFSKRQTSTLSKGVISKQKKQSVIEKILLFIRGNCFVPDARKFWVKPSVRWLSKYLQQEDISTIITTGPPHSLHLIGLQLKERLGVKWIADFRDPWTTIGYHKQLRLTKRARRLHEKLELQVLCQAHHIIVTSPSTKKEFQQKTTRPITVITNGYDTTHAISVKKDALFSVAHIGFLSSYRNPKLLWQVLGELVSEHKDFRNQFRLQLIGVVSHNVLQSIYASDLKDFVNHVGYVSHPKALKHQQQSQVLLLIEVNSEDTKAIIPGKLFEYMASNTPILAIGPQNSDVEEIINNTNTGVYCYYDEAKAMKRQLLDYFNAFKSNTLKLQSKGLASYSRRELTKKLAKLLWES